MCNLNVSIDNSVNIPNFDFEIEHNLFTEAHTGVNTMLASLCTRLNQKTVKLRNIDDNLCFEFSPGIHVLYDKIKFMSIDNANLYIKSLKELPDISFIESTQLSALRYISECYEYMCLMFMKYQVAFS